MQVVRIDQTIKNGELYKTENIKKACERAVHGNGRLHFLGLISDGGVVSSDSIIIRVHSSRSSMN